MVLATMSQVVRATIGASRKGATKTFLSIEGHIGNSWCQKQSTLAPQILVIVAWSLWKTATHPVFAAFRPSNLLPACSPIAELQSYLVLTRRSLA
jgi:hypothetical protein